MKWLIPALGLFIFTLPLAAQNSSLQGVITDAQGAIIPQAIVAITNTDTSAQRSTVSGATGAYLFAEVPPGPYSIEVKRPGFSTYVAKLTLQVSLPETLNVQLLVGQATTTVSVTAEVDVVNTENATVGNVFNTTQIESLPLQTRNIASLLTTQPGVTSGGNVLGGSSSQNYITLDGVDVNGFSGSSSISGGSGALPVPLDSVQEFRTVIAGQGADLGRASGGQVSIVTKGGSNQFHGALYEFNRNTDFEANDWFSNRAGVARPALIRNQYGADLGGPVKKNKLFFFYNYEGRKDRSQSATSDTVPSSTFAQGIVQVKLKSGAIDSLTPAQVKQIDPLGIGENPYILNLMQQYPAGNDPLAASDKGLNFNVLLFNAPKPLNNHVQVGKLDYILNNKQTISVRGTLNGASQVSSVELFPGQQPQSVSQDDSKGISARYTYVISSSLVNVANFGYTRGGSASTGTLNVVPTFGFTSLQSTVRGNQSFTPTQNYTDDLTWTRGKHTLQFGVNVHQVEQITNSANNEPSYGFNSQTLLQLGGDITGDVSTYLGGAALFSTSNVISAFGAIFGILNNGSGSYNYAISGAAIPFGQPITRDFKDIGPEFYAQDAWKVKPNLTVTYGLRYSIYGVPYEANGVEVVPTTQLNNYFAQRQQAAASGSPDYNEANAYITYKVAGPVNHGPAYFPTDYLNFAPRFGVAYAPKGTLEKFLGKGSALRAGYSILYDNYGASLASSFSSNGSPGLVSSFTQAVNTNYTTSQRYNGTSATYTTLTPPSGGAFPYTPPLLQSGFTILDGVSSDLKAPYEHLINVTYARPLPKHMSMEVSYAGRLTHRGLVQQDYGQPLSQYRDPQSGQTWQQAAGVLANLYYAGLTPAAVKANPSLVPLQPFFQNQTPGMSGYNFTGSASANMFYEAYQAFSGSWLDTLNQMDRIHSTLGGSANGGCIFITGCNTVFPTQASSWYTYTNAGQAAYNAMLVSIRRSVTNGWGYDFNYTWSHSIDDMSQGFQNSFIPTSNMGPSSFDYRHQINGNVVVDLPVGRGRKFGKNMWRWADGIVGGWQVSSLFTFHTGAPLNCSASGQYNVNYQTSSWCIVDPGAPKPATSGLTFDQLGIPNLFSNTSAGNNLVPGYAGVAGYNGLYRGLAFWGDDMAVNKNFKLPKESMRLTVRVEAYNVFNKQEFSNPSLSISDLDPGTTSNGLASNFGSSTFGEIKSSASSPRVLQAVMRITF